MNGVRWTIESWSRPDVEKVHIELASSDGFIVAKNYSRYGDFMRFMSDHGLLLDKVTSDIAFIVWGATK